MAAEASARWLIVDSPHVSAALHAQLEEVAQKAGLTRWAVAAESQGGQHRFGAQEQELFHAASTYKAAVLLGLLHAVAAGECRLEDQLHVRNRFRSVVDGAPFRVEVDRDGDGVVYKQLGRSLSLQALGRAMIVRSSNLATNLLLDFLTVERVHTALSAGDVEGVLVRRGVEDLAAHERGINNEASAAGLVQLFRHFQEGPLLPDDLRAVGLEILLAQEFNRMIPAQLPDDVKIAHKTGEISTHAHDAGIVLPPGAEPYFVAIMTESEAANSQRSTAVAEMSALLYRFMLEGRA